jgi:hypothetical protein
MMMCNVRRLGECVDGKSWIAWSDLGAHRGRTLLNGRGSGISIWAD